MAAAGTANRQLRIGSSPGIYRRPVWGALLLATASSMGMVVALWILDPGALDVDVVIPCAGLYASAVAYGIARSYVWRRRYGRVSYELTADRIRVLNGDEALTSLEWSKVLTVHLHGRYGWWELLTAQPVDEFPTLIAVTADRERVAAPPVLLWGNNVAEVERELASFRSS